MITTKNTTSENRLQTILLVIIILILVIIIGLASAVVALLKNQNNNSNVNMILSTTPTTLIETKNLLDTISSTQLLFQLKQLQIIADNNNGTRSTGTAGFNSTLNYIETQLRSKTNFQTFRQEFLVPLRVNIHSKLTSTIADVDQNYIDGTDFQSAIFSSSADFSVPIRLTIIPNSGCYDNDWLNATPYPAADSVALVINDRNCSMMIKSNIAQKYNITGLLVHDNTINATRLQNVIVSRNMTYPTIVISYELGTQLINATQNPLFTNVSIKMFVPRESTVTISTPSANLCADTPTGNKTQTIIIGSHSDSVPDGPGINDNGSGAMATLVLALNLAHLFQTSSYEKYSYRIRFCWWGAEENNMYGSFYHVEQANITNVEGNRLADYTLVLNFDMLASINYIFGIYDGISLPDVVSPAVKNATVKISQLFRNWFDKELLPWDHRAFISSDHVPFLVAGVVCGGTFSGADDTKTLEQKNRYDKMLIHGYGGTAGTKYDPCYHQACDTIENINLFAYETMVKSAAHVLETLARTPNLKLWLYTS